MAKFNIDCASQNDCGIEKGQEDVVIFKAKPKVNIIGFCFVDKKGNPRPPPPGFSTPTLSFEYDGSRLSARYGFQFMTDERIKGNGTGVIRNK
jgi:hypothetical protein